jgi:hypothetical protein
LATGQRGKVEKIKNPAIFWQPIVQIWQLLNSFFLKIGNFGAIFHKNHFYELQWISPKKKQKKNTVQSNALLL